MLILILWDQKFMKRAAVVPGALVAVALGVAANAFFTSTGSSMALSGDHLVSLPIITTLAEMRGAVELPDWSVITSGAVWTVAFTVAVIASLETLLSLEATDRIDPLKREAPANRELMAQGVGNMLCGLLGGLPMTGVIVRSSANVYAGGKTKASAILHGVLLLLAVILIPAILNMIPLAVLAAILIYTGWKLAHPRQLKYFLSKGFHQWLPFVATTAAILLTDLLKGIMVGLAVSVIFILLEHLRSPSYTIEPSETGKTRVRLHEHLTFLSKANLTELLQSFPKGSHVEIDGSACKRVDHDVMEVLREFREAGSLRGVTVRMIGLDLGPTGQGLAH
jgi:MFS superfamily sulfate permease-like transporter